MPSRFLHTAVAIGLFIDSVFSLPQSRRASPAHLILTDTGVGHRSQPVTRWPTSIRRLETTGKSAETLRQFTTDTLESPTGSSAIVVDLKAQHIYTATGQGIIRTNLDGSNNVTIIPETSGTALALAGGRLYYGTHMDGLIHRANLDGSNRETFLNVSQGIDYNIIPSFTPSWAYASGIAVDEEHSYIYWSASTVTTDRINDGSIRRAPLRTQGTTEPENVEVLVEGIEMPGQVRVVGDYVYWTEEGRWYNSPTALKRAKIPSTKKTDSSSNAITPETIVSSNQSSIFFEKDFTGDTDTLKITSFAVDTENDRLFFSIMSDLRTMWARIVETKLGGGELKVLNQNVTQIGIPTGLEYVG